MIRNVCDRASFRACAIAMLLGAAGMSLTGAAAEPTTARPDEATALKIGLLMDLSSGSAEVYRDRQRAFELAIRHVNEGGGVFGLPVTVAVGDTTADPEKAVAAARRLVEVEGVHAIVGPNASVNALPVAERVIGPAAIPTVSFSATSPELTGVADDDFLFRTALSDVSQGPVLARVARERGFDNVGLLHVDDPWGRGLAGAFEAAWDGPMKAVPVDRGQTGFLTALRESASGGAQALVVSLRGGGPGHRPRGDRRRPLRQLRLRRRRQAVEPGPVPGRRPPRQHVRHRARVGAGERRVRSVGGGLGRRVRHAAGARLRQGGL